MKMLIVLSALVFSTQSFATQDKCYETAKSAAFKYAVNEDMALSMDEFGTMFGNENLKVEIKKDYQIEYWAFGDGSKFINVEVQYANKKCTVKDLFLGQDDQDQDE